MMSEVSRSARKVAYSPVVVWTVPFVCGTVATGQLKQTLEGHMSEVWSVAFSQDGSILASGSLDGTILCGIWPSGRSGWPPSGNGN